MLNYSQLDPHKEVSVKFEAKWNIYHLSCEKLIKKNVVYKMGIILYFGKYPKYVENLGEVD